MTAHSAARPWRVLQQQSNCDDIEVCSHRFELTADLHAIWRGSRSRRETGVFYTVRRREEVAS
jgi:hypothetical protein